MTRPRIVFVESSQELERMRRGLKDERRWDLCYCPDSVTAEAELERGGVTAVVVGGARLDWLDGVRARWPGAVRIAINGPGGVDAILRTLAVAHQYLGGCCDLAILVQVLEQAMLLLDLLDDPEVKGATGSMNSLPTLPKAYWRLVEAMYDPDLGIRHIAGMVEADPALSARILTKVNSSYYGLSEPVNSVRQAVGFLGPEVAAGLALASFIAQAVRGQMPELGPIQHGEALAPFPDSLDLQEADVISPVGQALYFSLIQDIGIILFSVRVPAQRSSSALLGIWACG